MQKRAVTTLFLLASVDGKISTGSTDNMDFDKDLATLEGVKEGLEQYYAIEQTTDLWSLNSGRVQQKIGVNVKDIPPKTAVNFVLVDNTHLNEHGVKYFCARSNRFVLVTSNLNHPAYTVKADNLYILYQPEFDPEEMLHVLYRDFGCERITVQTGGTLNSIFLRKGLIDYVDIVVAPILVGGKDTSTVIDGPSVTVSEGLKELGVLQLESAKKLEYSYVRLKYKVLK